MKYKFRIIFYYSIVENMIEYFALWLNDYIFTEEIQSELKFHRVCKFG
jgi:hypothetical protein